MTLVDTEQLRAEYLRLREIVRNLGNQLVDTVDMNELREGGERLGMLHDGTFVFNSETEAAVLADYCLYNLRQKGRNAIDRYLINNPPSDDSPEAECLRAMQHATYDIFLVESVEPGLGVHVREATTGAERFIIDLGLAKCAEPKIMFVSRLWNFARFSMTGGAALPLGVMRDSAPDNALDTMASLLEQGEDGYPEPAQLIRMILANEPPSQDPRMYVDSSTQLPHQQPYVTSARIGRNQSCPCGSGKKFKQCCMRK